MNRASGLILAFSFEPDHTVFQGEQRIISADAYIGARMDLGSALSVQNVAGLNKLAVRSLGPKPL